jgi:hypothetical protein
MHAQVTGPGAGGCLGLGRSARPRTASPALASHIYVGFGSGSGATSQAAESAAITNLNEVNADCLSGTITLVYDTQQSSGTWAAEVSAKCLTPGS